MIRHLFRYESKHQPVLPIQLFYNRLARSVLAGGIIVSLFLSAGMVGYHLSCDYKWVDSLLNASMILSGMGPVEPKNCGVACQSDCCKIFASMYALICGIGLVTSIGVIVAPVAHRIFHKFHLQEEEDGK